jgi:uncharacterized protein YbaP (TraB family)
MIFFRIFLILASFFLSVLNVNAQQQYPSTLLWRITGKNLLKPSYLYGTMHVQDRRLFYFTDSLYNAIEKTEGFAMEIDPDEMLDSLYKSFGKKDTSALLKKILTENEYKRIAKQLEKKLKIPADKITTKRLADEKKRWYNTVPKKDDMSAIMDLYLFSIARKQGKYTCGIEDLNDQFEIVDEVGKFNIDDFIKSDTIRRMNYLEQMKKVYIDKDLTALNKMVNGDLHNAYKDLLMIKRNKKMAARMDSLVHIRSSFFAVGAAHLPGDSGVITLLQRNGFTVEPVLSSTSIIPEEYKYTAKEISWIKIEDENKMCSMEMPAIPSTIRIGEMPMKMYMDISDMSVYGLAVTAVTNEEAATDSFFNHLISSYKKRNFDIKSVKNIEYKNCKGIEMHALQKGQGEYRYRLIVKENKLFIVIFGGQENAKLYTPNAEKFFNSLSFNEENVAGKNNWQSFVNKKNAFSMMAPGKTVESIERDTEGVSYDKYTSVDYADGSYYMVIIRDTKPGYIIESDSLYFDEYKKNFNVLTGNRVKEFSTVQFKNYNSCHFMALQTADNTEFVIQGYLIRRGNRSYIPMVVTSKDKADFPNVTNFFRSFTPLQYDEIDFKKEVLSDKSFSTLAPGKFEKIEEDTTAYSYDAAVKKYQINDKNSAITYSVEVEHISPYYWSNTDSTFFKESADGFMRYNDSLITYKYNDGPVKNAEVLIKYKDIDLYKKLKTLINGDSLYTLYAYLTAEGLKNEGQKAFFNNAFFLKNYPTTIFNNKAIELFSALQSNDSVISSNAKKVLPKISFTKSDLPLLYNAVLKKYKNFENDYRALNEIIADEISKLEDSSTLGFVRNHYFLKSDTTDDIQMLQLQMLSKYKTDDSYRLLKELLLKELPVKGNVYNLVYPMEDTINLVKSFFPEAVKLYGDSILGGAMMKLALTLIDSNVIDKNIVLQNHQGVFSLAKKQYDELIKTKENAYPLFNTDLINFLGRLNTSDANLWLNKFSSLPNLWIKNNAIIALLKNNQPVSAIGLKKLASDKEWRTAFWESLKKINKQQLFPREFYTQLKFAESYLYNYLIDEYEIAVNSMQFIKEKTAVINGKKKVFYLYKVVSDDEEDATPRLAICGTFDLNKNVIEIKSEEVDVFYNYDVSFSLKNIDAQFNKYIGDRNRNK